jgi:hypothetical protein
LIWTTPSPGTAYYNSTFRIRFNQFDNFQIPFDGMALDDISVTGVAARRLVVTVPANANEGAGVLSGGQVLLGEPVRATLAVQLHSSDPSKVSVPSSIIIPAGSDRAAFDLTVFENGQLDGTVAVTISAGAPGHFGQDATIAISDNETAGLRVMLPPRAREGDGTMVKMGSVRAHPKPVREIRVALRSSVPEKLRVPATVIIPASQGSASFDLFAGNDGNIDGSQSVTVTAHVENWADGNDTILVLDNDAPALAVVLPAALSEGNRTVTNAGAVRLSGALSTNLLVTLSSSDSSELVVPRLVEIPAGQVEMPFDLTVIDDAQADAAQTVTVTARAPAFANGSGTMTVFDDETPPLPYAPDPPDTSTNVPVTLALSWKPGMGEVVSEGGFESGTFLGWVTRDSGFGSWVINDGLLNPDGPDGPTNAFAGEFSSMTVQIGAGEHLLYQDVFIPQDAQSATLTWAQLVRNHAAYFSVPNQQFRVEIRSTADEVLAVAFETKPEDMLLQDWKEHSFDVSPFRGRTIRIAFHQMDNLGYFNVHIDQVSVKLGAPEVPTLFEVYFGATSRLGAASKLAPRRTRSGAPRLALNAKLLADRFPTRASPHAALSAVHHAWRGSVHHFEWGRMLRRSRSTNVSLPCSRPRTTSIIRSGALPARSQSQVCPVQGQLPGW